MYLNVVLVAVLLSSSVDSACIQTYQELQHFVFSQEKNIDNLRRAFFPTNQEPSISVEIQYYFHNWSLPYPLIFRWSASWSLGFIRPKLMQSLTLHIFNKMPPLVNIVVDPPCDDPDLHSSLSDWEAICYGDEKWLLQLCSCLMTLLQM